MSNSHIKRVAHSSRVFSELLTDITTEILIDFQGVLSSKLSLPTSIWKYNDSGDLEQILPKNPLTNYPDFCIYLNENRIDKIICSECDMDSMASFLQTISNQQDYRRMHIVPCPFKLSRIVFPLEINGNILGSLSVGKFVNNGETQINSIAEVIEKVSLREQCPDCFNTLTNDELATVRNNLINKTTTIPAFSDNEIKHIENEVFELLPLLKSLCAHIHPSDIKFKRIILLDSLDYSHFNVMLSEHDLWENIKSILDEIVEQLNLSSAVIYLSDLENYQQMHCKAFCPNTLSPPETISVQSTQELQLLIENEMGVLVPNSKNKLNWLGKNMVKLLFGSNDGIIYGKNIFAGKLLIVGYGFKEYKEKSKFEIRTLKEATNRLFKIANNALSTVELDHIMSEAGHMLGRARNDIEAGMNALKKYGFTIRKKDSARVTEIKQDSHNAIDSGLTRISLIIKNYNAFKTIRNIHINHRITEQRSRHLRKELNVVDVINYFISLYSDELKSSKKNIQKEYKYENCNIYIDIEQIWLIELMFWNLVDNAVKYSYNRKYIHILTSKNKNNIRISFSNFGIGIAQDEYTYVFKRFYQSRFKDEKKKRIGGGYGLAIVKKIMDTFFGEGRISIKSVPANDNKYGEARFEGDKYITTITLNIPCEGCHEE